KRESNSIYKKTQNIIKKFESVFSNDYVDIISFLLLVQLDMDKIFYMIQLIQTAENFIIINITNMLLLYNTILVHGIHILTKYSLNKMKKKQSMYNILLINMKYSIFLLKSK